MYPTLKMFLAENSMETLLTYDFKNESPWTDVVNEPFAIKKFQRYKLHNQSVSWKFDCDGFNGSCKLANDIYRTLWGWHFKTRFSMPKSLADNLGSQWKRLGSDTMNSFATIYNVAEKIYQENPTALFENSRLNKFASFTHNIGNFTLIPFKLDSQDRLSFNQSRGFNGGSNYFVFDFFDLSLKLIKEKTDDPLFKSYIDLFFLNDYVDENYNIKPLFSRHGQFLQEDRISLENPEKFLPQNEEELNELLDNILKLIQKRGQRILEELKKHYSEDISTSGTAHLN